MGDQLQTTRQHNIFVSGHQSAGEKIDALIIEAKLGDFEKSGDFWEAVGEGRQAVTVELLEKVLESAKAANWEEDPRYKHLLALLESEQERLQPEGTFGAAPEDPSCAIEKQSGDDESDAPLTIGKGWRRYRSGYWVHSSMK